MVGQRGQDENHEERRRDRQGAAELEDGPAEGPALQHAFGSARRAFATSFDKLTGSEFRRQFQEFTNVVSTTVLGVHRDQAAIREKLAEVERSVQARAPTPPSWKPAVWALVFSLVAVTVSVAALVAALL